MSTADLEHPSLLPSVLLGDLRDGSRPGRSTRDWLVDLTAFVLAVVLGGALFAFAADAEDTPQWLMALDLVAGFAACCGLWVRRRWPVGLALAIAPVTLFSSMAGVASCIALFTVAVHRPTRTVVWIAALYLAAIPVYTLLRPTDDSFWVSVVVGVLVTAGLIAWGMFVRARRQLVYSLRDRAQRAEAEQELRIAQARRMERDRIAREMHDVLAHRISLVSLHAGALEYSGAPSPEDVSRAAGVIRGAAHQALDDLREVIGVLREDGAAGGEPERPQPTIADLGGLLEESRAAGMRVRGDLAVAEDVPTSVGRNAYRVVQEALTNARKHAPGCAVGVAVAGAPGDGLTIEVRNPLPVGRAVSRIPGAGTGIVGLTERVALGNGRIEHGPRDGEWRLWVWLPLAGGVMPIRVLIVDDDALVRAGLTMILNATEDVRVVAEAADGSEVLGAVDAYAPDVVLMDIRMPRMDGLAATEALTARDAAPEIIVLTTFDADEYVLRALRSGASGFLLKDTPPADIVQAIRLVVAGEAMLSPGVTRRLIGHVAEIGAASRRTKAQELLGGLTDREREVAEAIGRGSSNAEIAEELFMSVATVKAHVTRLLTKLEVANRVQIALLAHDAGG